jgi:hypothetical protein
LAGAAGLCADPLPDTAWLAAARVAERVRQLPAEPTKARVPIRHNPF